MAKLRLTYPSFRQPSEVILGTGSIRALADRPDIADAVFFTSSQPAVVETLAAALAHRRVSVDPARILTKPHGEPDLSGVSAGAEWLARHDRGLIIGIGGGSVLDWCRLAWARAAGVIAADGTAGARVVAVPAPRFVLVPTTCATGAEAASVAVFTLAARKVPVVAREFLAEQVILDGQFLRHLDRQALARSLADALSHAIEAFTSIVPNPLAKEAAVSGLRLLLVHGDAPPSACRNERLMEAAYLAGLAASNCSVGVVHAFAHTIAAHGFPHGLANALALEAGIRANAAAPALKDLTTRAGLRDVDALAARIAVLTDAAASADDRQRVATLLDNPAKRAAILDGMSGDVCFRSNPLRLTRTDLERMLDDVERLVRA
jgi:alcohol dehydrogenase